MGLTFRVDWTVSGTSYVEVENEDIATVVDDNFDPDQFSDEELFEFFDAAFMGDLRHELVDMFDERGPVQVDEVTVE